MRGGITKASLVMVRKFKTSSTSWRWSRSTRERHRRTLERRCRVQQMYAADDARMRRKHDRRPSSKALLLIGCLRRLREEHAPLCAAADLSEPALAASPRAVGPRVTRLGNEDPIRMAPPPAIQGANAVDIKRLVIADSPALTQSGNLLPGLDVNCRERVAQVRLGAGSAS